MHGLRVANATPANLARVAVEGLLCALADQYTADPTPEVLQRYARVRDQA